MPNRASVKGKANNVAFLFLSVFLSIFVLFIVGYYFSVDVYADDVTASVTVGNTAPSLGSGHAAENPASSGTSPTNEGSDVTFEATATDSNSEDYYLAICTTNAVTPHNSGAPTCTVGTWCVSTATDSTVEATCSYTTLGTDAQSNAWFAFVCDGNASAAACSASGDQGDGSDSGSPFKVNHDPSFSAVSDDGGGGADSGANPGGTMTFGSTASDSDNDTAQDQVRIVVCADTDGATYSGCAGVQLCISSNGASNPSCQYNVPAVTADGNNNYYAYVFDSHQFGSASNYRSGVYVVNNVSPTVTGATINGGSAISLTEGTTTNVVATATVADNNSCQDLSTVTVSLYRLTVAYTGCDTALEDNNNYCYAVESCTVDVGTCTGSSDSSATYTCTVAFQYYADPTIANTEFPTDTWLDTVVATDDDAATGTDEVNSGVEMNTTEALDVTSTINYGSLDVGQSNDPLDKTTTVTATGNVGLDTDMSGTDMSGVPSGSIDSTYQHFATTGVAYASGAQLRNEPPGPDELELNCEKTDSGTAKTKDIYWGILIPSGTVAGTYSGTNAVVAVMGETANW